jgi:putative nucleotidyltransferase with HDIG domain
MEASSARERRIIVFLRGILFVSLIILSYLLLVMPMTLRPSALPLRPGDVAPRDLQAPRDIEYISEVRTEDARAAAENAVAPVYAPADPSIARKQIERLRAALHYISTVRADEYASPDEKASDLLALQDISLSEKTIETLLALSDSRWEAVSQESLRVLEQVMRNTIREEDVETLRHSVPSYVSLSLSEAQAQIVSELVTAFVVPNSLYSEEMTDAARQSARDAVKPVTKTYKAGETIVAAGEIITPEKFEALELLNLIQPQRQWMDYVGAGALTLSLAVFIFLYFRQRRPLFWSDIRSLAIVGILFLVFLAGTRLTFPSHTILPYLYPLPAFGLLIATLFGLDAALALMFALSLLAAYGIPDVFGVGAYHLLTAWVGILVLGAARRVWAFVRAGMAISALGITLLVAYRLPFSPVDWVGAATLAGAAAFDGLASASLTLLLQYFLAQMLGVPTALQLLEISRPDTPLLQFFLRSAPGTYQHSLQVANLAEQAAERIGADALLVRVGALFHDIGKALNPAFFIENQTPGSLDTHQDMDPVETAQTIIRHVTDGLTLAKKYHLPKRIMDFIREHHGTLITRYQYNQALEAAGGDVLRVDIEKFRYPGPPPRSRETALLMLADGVEARARAERPQDEGALRSLVQSVIEYDRQAGQLDDTLLTLRDLHLIADSFVSTLRGAHHFRIQYPKELNENDSTPTVPRGISK